MIGETADGGRKIAEISGSAPPAILRCGLVPIGLQVIIMISMVFVL
jgi:hypothetical protein